MDRTNAPGNIDRRYIDEDRNVGVQGTAIIAADRNAVQEELIHAIESGGLSPNAGDETQLRQAIEAIAAQQALMMPPVGTIWMYDGAGWVDNVTLPGWYACIPENEDGGANGLAFGIRSMVDRFVVGGTPTSAGTVGGANSYQLTVDQLPAHTHAIDHDHGVVTSSNQSTNHTHGYSRRYIDRARNAGGAGTTAQVSMSASDGGWSGYWLSGGASSGQWGSSLRTQIDHPTTGANSASHNHSVAIPPHSGQSGHTGGGATVDNRPAHYTMIYIRKCH